MLKSSDVSLRDKVRKIIQQESTRCSGTDGGKLSLAREELKKRYLGYGYSNDEDREQNQLSTYVDRTVMETTEWAKPSLMRVFAGGDEIIRFDPRTPEQEQPAQDATLYVNQVVFGRNMFRLLHDVLTDGLYQRVGWCLAHCPQETSQEVRQYSGLSQQEAEALLTDPSVDLSSPDSVQAEQYDTPLGPMFDLTVRKKVKHHTIRLDPVPSENVIFSSDAADVEHARFIAHWEIKTASDLLKEGYGKATIDDLPPYDSKDEMPEHRVGEEVNAESSDDEDSGVADENRQYKIYEAWTDADINGDGIAEKIKVTYAGDGKDQISILDIEEWPLYRAPLFAACSVPMPHQIVGLCLADLVKDVQDLRTDMTRQYLDGLALSNQGELILSEGTNGKVDLDSLLKRGPGNVVRIGGDAKIEPLPVASSSADAVQGLQLSDQLIEKRTGVTSRTQSLQADTLQNTATGASIQEEAINQRLELIARVYAEEFFKPLGRYVLHLLNRYQDKQIQLRLKGKFMQFDPRKWDPDMDISVAVGLGTGNRSRLVGAYNQILAIQKSFIQMLGANSPIRLSNVIYTCHKMAEAAGLEAPERFFGTEEDAKKAEQAALKSGGQQVSPEQQKAQAQIQQGEQKLQLQAQAQQQNAQLKQSESAAKMQLAQQDQQNKVNLRAMEIQGERALDQTRLLMGQTGGGLTQLKNVSQL